MEEHQQAKFVGSRDIETLKSKSDAQGRSEEDESEDFSDASLTEAPRKIQALQQVQVIYTMSLPQDPKDKTCVRDKAQQQEIFQDYHTIIRPHCLAGTAPRIVGELLKCDIAGLHNENNPYIQRGKHHFELLVL